MNSLQITEVDNEVLADADAYLREHKILELFEVSHTGFHTLSETTGMQKLVAVLSDGFTKVSKVEPSLKKRDSI